jgi:hypothetical protein
VIAAAAISGLCGQSLAQAPKAKNNATPVVYLYLDRLSNAFAGWGRSKDADGERQTADHGSIKQAAE